MIFFHLGDLCLSKRNVEVPKMILCGLFTCLF